MTTDPTPLQERIARALYENAEYYGPAPTRPPWDSRDDEERGEWMEIAAAVLPIIAAAREAVPAPLDALAAAEHRATRAEAQSAIRGRAVAIYQQRAREAEARIKAVRDVLDEYGDPEIWAEDIRRALDGDA